MRPASIARFSASITDIFNDPTVAGSSRFGMITDPALPRDRSCLPTFIPLTMRENSWSNPVSSRVEEKAMVLSFSLKHKYLPSAICSEYWYWVCSIVNFSVGPRKRDVQTSPFRTLRKSPVYDRNATVFPSTIVVKKSRSATSSFATAVPFSTTR